MNPLTEYPLWVCGECAEEAGGKWPKGHVATVNCLRCGVCERETCVTHPRAYGRPSLECLNAVRARLQNAAPAGGKPEEVSKPEEVMGTEYAF